MAKTKNHILSIGAFAVMFAAALWALDLIVLRPSLFHLDVSVVVLLEHLVAFAFMLIPLILEWKEVKKLTKLDWGAFLLIAVVSGAIGTMAITKALFFVNFINLSVVVFLQKLQPVFAIILAMLLLKERPVRTFYFWAVLALVGGYFVTFGFNTPVFDVGNKVFMASLLAIAAAAAFGSSTVFSKFAVTKINFRVGTYLRFGMTTIVMLFIVTAFGNWGGLGAITPTNLLTLLIIAFSTGGVAIFIYYYGLKKIPASVATIAELMFPFSAVILEYLIRGTIMSLGQWLGATLLIVSILAITQRRKGIIRTAIRNQAV